VVIKNDGLAPMRELINIGVSLDMGFLAHFIQKSKVCSNLCDIRILREKWFIISNLFCCFHGF
ncbi:hypothetical protein ACSGQ1_23425, partial [Providencia hangzhouensis]